MKDRNWRLCLEPSPLSQLPFAPLARFFPCYLPVGCSFPSVAARAGRLILSLLFSSCLFFAVGCGAPGEPTAPSPPIPVAVTDLSSRQQGDGAQLTFTMPTKTIRGERLGETPAIEILRGALKPDGTPDGKSFRVVQTIPGSLVGKYVSADRVQIVDPIPPEESRAHPGAVLAYRTRTRVSKKRASADSNITTVRIFPVPQRPVSVQAKVSETAITLTWTVSPKTSGGDPLPAAPEQRIYRGELDPHSYDPATKDLAGAKWITPIALLARADSPTFTDTQFEFGHTYFYLIRSAATMEGNALESDDSEPLVVTPVDIFPPSTPQNIVAAVASATPDGAPEVDLSWSINPETDLAGYRVYRSEREDDKGELVTPDLLLSPAYRDTSVRLGGRYWYRVTAVDRAGNESALSAPVLADVAQHSS
jgi:hypothetical protein